MTASKLDEMMAAAKVRAEQAQAAKAECEAHEREAAQNAAVAKAEEVFVTLLGADLYAELGVEVRAEKYPTSSEQYFGVGAFTYADEVWGLKYDDRAGRYGAASTPVLIVDIPGLPKERMYSANARHGEVRFGDHYDTKLLVLLSWFGEDKAAQLSAERAQEQEWIERNERDRREVREHKERNLQLVADAKKEEAAILEGAEAFFALQRAGLWRWPTGYELVLYHWRWCIGHSPDGGAEFDDAYALTDSLTEDGWLTTFEATPRELKLIPEAHKPVVELRTFTSVSSLDGGLAKGIVPTYGADSIRRSTVGEWPNQADVWVRCTDGSEWTPGIERTIGHEPVKWLAAFIDAQVGSDAARDPLPPVEESAEQPYVEDIPF